MADELLTMLKKVLFYDALIALIVGAITYFLLYDYYLYILVGIITAILSFFLNGIITNYVFNNKKGNHKIIMTLSSLFRVIIVCAIALLMFNYNKISIFPFLLGYSLHFIGIILYSFKIKN
ncbi:ATP synthase subunit I [Clostridium rectalis]|uniref:ATP synthase subunit I n=1 Tax=Clostridium rectalis TaxID=2040295 RepID=UPI000F638E9A|nr:ATP synthase subunit I [Clostridium rectalis]